VSTFRNILRLFAGDLAAKALQVLTFVYVARILGPEPYGVLEFALAATSYLLIAGDWGVELWATREVSRALDLRQLAARVVGVRLTLGSLAYLLLLALLPIVPDYTALRSLLVVAGLLVLANSLSLRWALLGRERLSVVAASLVVGQVVASLVVIAFVRDASALAWVIVGRAAGDFVLAGIYARYFVREAGGFPNAPTLAGWREVVGPASVMGAIQILGVLSYNFDSIVLGALVGPVAVGLYGAAYKVVTVVVAASMTYYTGLFPALARTWLEGRDAFLDVARRSFRIATLTALPIGVAGTLLADLAIPVVYGRAYEPATPALRVLCWSASLVVLRGTFRNALTASGAQNLDLRCAAIATAVNVVLNLTLIERFGMLGAASATVTADFVWFVLVWYHFRAKCVATGFFPALVRPAVATVLMAVSISAVRALPIELLGLAPGAATALALAGSSAAGAIVYVVALVALGEPEARDLVRRLAPARD
jgi:O-antigen/teichoic acid export membrane protein